MIREDIAALLELERKTKAKIIAPLVHVKRKTFWPWQTRAYHAYRHREDIAIAQLQLRADMGVSPDESIELVSSLFKETYERFCMWPDRGKLFLFLMPEDALQPIWGMVDGDSYDDLGILHLFDLYESMYGRLTEEETDRVCKMETVGELSALLTKVAEEGREKANCVRGGCMACASHFYIRMRNYTWYADSGADRTRPAVVEKLWYNMRRFKEGNKTCLTQF